MKKPETKFKEKVLRDLKTLEYCCAEKIQQVGKCGTLDIWMTYYGRSVLLELKATDKDKMSKIQILKAFRHVAAGGFAYCVHPGNWLMIFTRLKNFERQLMLRTFESETYRCNIVNFSNYSSRLQ